MREYEQQMLDSLRSFLQGQPAEITLTKEEDWQKLWSLCAEQKVLPMVLDALAPTLAQKQLACGDLSVVRRNILHTVVIQMNKSQSFLQLYQQFLDAGCCPLVVKGILCRRLYPKPDLRPSSDEDLLVRQEEFPEILEVIRRAGLTIEDETAEQVVACRDPKSGLYLELHRSLFSFSSTAYGGLNDNFKKSFTRAVELEVEGQTIWTLCPQDHLLYLILHSLKHFLHAGFGVRQVCDICLFVRDYGAQVDWLDLARKLKAARSDVFGANLLEIGRAYLGFPAYPVPTEEWLASFGGQLDCEDLLEDLLAGGIYGGNTEERLHSSLITLHAAGGEAREKRLLRTLFPSWRELAGAYPYVARHRWMLPAAWGQRIWNYWRAGGGSAAARESIAIGEKRVELLKKYRVIQ